MTIDQIAQRLALYRSTIYYWVRDLPIPRKEFDPGPSGAARRRGVRAMQTKFRLIREAAYDEGRREFAERLEEPGFRDFVCLYIAEGHKRDRNNVSLGNSDPDVIRLANRWICALSRNPVRYRVQYHTDQDIEELRRFWSEVLGVEAEAIRLQRKSNSNQLEKRTWRSEHGVLTVSTSDTGFHARLQAWMTSLRLTWT
ncbi:MAG: hypothetical protein LC808_19410 [Actinobacteria bacterium]|nr:hypothetical protein [Actinomycetota bacterium]